MKKKFAIILVFLLFCTGMIFAVQGLQKKFVNEAVNSSNENKTLALNEDNKVKSVTDTGKAGADAATPKSNDSQVKPEQANNSAVPQKQAEAASSTAKAANSTIAKPAQQQTQQTQTNTQTQNKTSIETQTPKQPPETPKQPANFTIMDTVHSNTILSCHVDYPNGTVEKITSDLLKSNNIPFRTINSISGSYFSMIANLRERDAGPNSGWCYYINGSKASVGASGYIPQKDDIIIWKYLADGLSN